MQEVLKIYFGRIEIKFYLLLGLLNLAYIINSGSLFNYWYIFLIVIAVSPLNEYLIHKYFLHMPMPKNKTRYHIIAGFLEKVHYAHHSDPKDVNHIFAQLWITLPALLIDIALGLLITKSFAITMVISTSIIFYYMIYEWFHFLAHSAYTPKNRYSAYMKKYHLLHHYKNEKLWFGVTSPLADFILKGYKNPELVEKSPTVKTISPY